MTCMQTIAFADFVVAINLVFVDVVGSGASGSFAGGNGGTTM